ncbi:HIT family protein [Methanohalophilus euhalobius]|uniref:HIT family protein n=1 Tax=Methanohalophilus euhalobius TaxID=51203 RepID=A0A314ZVS2_9EURY|nr:HIT family protein [Methanohalophilus euhalobius]PQV43119.1 histidine triad (HIT) family protein [Methanohalophilus euhalobius]RNI09316.1 HIT family protein [Methanohalophilus euhalobius]
MDCLFCRIVNEEIPSHKVYEDEHAYAFLDIYPTSRGHTVVLPKEHITSFLEMSEEKTAELFASVNRIAKKVIAVTEAPGVNIGINNGLVAGQTVPHVHVHIIPRYENDGGGSMHTIVDSNPDREELEQLASVIHSKF